MRLRLILLSLLLIGGSIVAIGGLDADLLILIALIGGVVIVLDWANKPHKAKREELHQKPVSETVIERHESPRITRQAALVGGLVGFIHGLILAIEAQLIYLPFFNTNLIPMIKSDPRYGRLVADPRFTANLPKAMSMLNMVFAGITVALVPFGALIGCICGVLFVGLKEHIPSRSLVRKSLVFSLILLGIMFLLSLRGLLYSATNSTLMPEFSQLLEKIYLITLVEFPLLGFLFGYILERKVRQNAVLL